MILLTARIFPVGATPPLYDPSVKSMSILLNDGRNVYVEVRDVVAAFEIEERKV